MVEWDVFRVVISICSIGAGIVVIIIALRVFLIGLTGQYL